MPNKWWARQPLWKKFLYLLVGAFLIVTAFATDFLRGCSSGLKENIGSPNGSSNTGGDLNAPNLPGVSPTNTPATPGGGIGKYVALGDSYTAGPDSGVNTSTPAGCDRSRKNYPHLVASEVQPTAFVDASCNGATSLHLSKQQETKDGTNAPQLDAVTPDTSLVTLSFGGDEIGLSELAKVCDTWDNNGSPCKTKFNSGGQDQLAAKANTAVSKVTDAIAEIHQRAPQARVIVVGFPTVFPENGGCRPALSFGAPDVAYLRGVLDNLNTKLAQQAKANSAEFVDAAAVTKGHDVCADKPWVYPANHQPAALRPTASGEAAISKAVLGTIHK